MKIKLNHYEKDMLETYENDEWIGIPGMKKEVRKNIEYARVNPRKDKKVHIRISQKDLDSIQRQALEAGISYQTMISSLLHKYVNGKLIEKNRMRVK